MLDKLSELKQNKKWLYYLMIVPVIILFLREMYSKYLIISGKKIVEDVEKKDEQLKEKQMKAEIEAELLKKKADEIRDQKKEGVDKDWHLK